MENQLIHSTNVYSMYSVCQAESHTTERAMASAIEKLTAIKLGKSLRMNKRPHTVRARALA